MKISTKCKEFFQLIILHLHPHFTSHIRKQNPQNHPHFTCLKIRRSAHLQIRILLEADNGLYFIKEALFEFISSSSRNI